MSNISETIDKDSAKRVTINSSLAGDVWHSRPGERSYEWWYFDALSDDGHEAVAITFTDNYVFSPRYATFVAGAVSEPRRFPAISFLYSSAGKTLFRTINEYSERQFESGTDEVRCTVGQSSFRIDSVSYGSGYLIKINIPVSPTRTLIGTFEWLMIDADLSTEKDQKITETESWNIVSPRSDVSGRIELVGRSGRSKRTCHFRGTGYHDHLVGSEAIQDTVTCRQWGRAHFIDTTAIYRVERSNDLRPSDCRLLLVRDGKLSEASAEAEPGRFRRDKFGVKYPRRLNITADNGVRLRIKPIRVIESSFYNVRFLSEMTLMLRDGKPRKTIGITEHLSPRNSRFRLFRWISDLSIGKNGRGPIL